MTNFDFALSLAHLPTFPVCRLAPGMIFPYP
jgi:hypothetical protein